MVLYYAMGGGLGHLARADAFLRMLNIPDFRIITASPYSVKIFKPDKLILIPSEFEAHPELLTDELQKIINQNQPESIFIDTFSHGILGELNHIAWGNSEVNYITRRVKWNRYASKVNKRIRFSNTYILETLEPEHQRFIEQDSGQLFHTEIQYPGHETDGNCDLTKPQINEKWLIIHSGPGAEVLGLIEKAKNTAIEKIVKPAFYLITQVDDINVEGITQMRVYPAHGYFDFADRIFSGCGFNIMKQTENYRMKHCFHPFERKYDDQFWRAEEARKEKKRGNP
jgi:hypothetical protein